MPCDSQYTVPIEWSPDTDQDLLKESLKARGYTDIYENRGMIYASNRNNGGQITYSTRNNKMTVTPGYDEGTSAADIERELKQAYGRQLVQNTADRFGWRLKQTGKNTFVAQKRVLGR